MSIVAKLQDHFVQNNDFTSRRLFLGPASVVMLGLGSLIDFPQTVTMIRNQLHIHVPSDRALSEHALQEMLIGLGQDCSEQSVYEIASEILLGMLIVVEERSGTCVSLSPVQQTLSRPISTPLMENNILGSSSAFNEDIDSNIGLLRRHMYADELEIKTYMFGETVKNRVTISYLNGSIHPSFLKELIEAIESRLSLEVNNLQGLAKAFGKTTLNLISHFNTTEMPQTAMRALHNGRAVIFIERLPFAIVVPSLVTDLFVTEEDLNHPLVFSILLRTLRLIGVLTTLVAPGLYVALVSVNPDVLRFELAHSIAKSRLEVPYPAIVETLLLLFVLELLMEAIIRLPSTVGPTVTMVGGIVLGEATVAAKLVSNLLIIVLAVITISSATVAGTQNSLSVRLFKYLLLFLSAAFGVLGLMTGLVILCSYLAGIKTFNIPYLQFKKPKGE